MLTVYDIYATNCIFVLDGAQVDKALTRKAILQTS